MSLQASPTHHVEFRLVAACCRRAFSGEAADVIVECAPNADPDTLVAAAARHRVEGLVWSSLQGLDVPLPDAIARRLSARARAIADHGLRAAAESARLQRAFEQAGIDLLFLKGLILGALAYGNPFLKMSWDIDVLVRPNQIGDAAVLLERLGYRLVDPAPTERHRLARWHRRFKESLWHHEELGLHLELHDRLLESPWLIPGVGIDSPSQKVELAPGIAVPTLARDELFAYLCAHGALSGWNRLKWLSDFAGYCHHLGEPEVARLYSRSQSLGAGRAAAQALLLARAVFGLDLDPSLKKELSADRATRRLVDIALRLLTRPGDPIEARLGTLPIHWSHLLLAPRWSTKMLELKRKISELLYRAR